MISIMLLSHVRDLPNSMEFSTAPPPPALPPTITVQDDKISLTTLKRVPNLITHYQSSEGGKPVWPIISKTKRKCLRHTPCWFGCSCWLLLLANREVFRTLTNDIGTLTQWSRCRRCRPQYLKRLGHVQMFQENILSSNRITKQNSYLLKEIDRHKFNVICANIMAVDFGKKKLSGKSNDCGLGPS